MDIGYFYDTVKQPDAWVNRGYAMQAALRNLLPENRAAWCLTDSAGQIKPPVIIQKISDSSKYYRYYKGLFCCRNGWICPHCAPSIARDRSQFIESGIKKWRGDRYGLDPSDPTYSSKKGKELRLALFTVPHKRNEALNPLINKIKLTFRKALDSREYRRLKKDYDITGNISILEVTHSKMNGWHPHFHVLFFFNDVVNDDALKESLFNIWSEAAVNNEFRMPEIEGFGLQDADFASDYLAKHGRQRASKWNAANEVSKWHVKHGNESFTPFDLLEAHLLRIAIDKSLVNDSYVRNNAYKFFEDASSLFVEFADAFKGRHQCQWSHGLKELLKPSKEERINKVLAAVSDEIERNDSVRNIEKEDVLHRLSPEEWRQVNKLDARCYFLNNFQSFTFKELKNGEL